MHVVKYDSLKSTGLMKGSVRVEDLKIEPYQPERDKAQIDLLLHNDNYLLERFYQDEERNKDNILVALRDSKLVGFLSFNGFCRKPEAILYVRKEYEAEHIGPMLINQYEEMLVQNERVEHTIFTCSPGDVDVIGLLENNDYRLYFSSYMMERIGEAFPASNIVVRNYEDDDYYEWDRICELAFYYMRQRVGMYPSFFYKPLASEREGFAHNKQNMFVMTVDNTIVAIGRIDGNKIGIVAVSNEHQSRGYGRPFVQFLVNEIIRRGEEKATLQVVKGNFAKSLYESLGFKEYDYHYFYIKYFRPETRLSAPPDNY